LSAQQPLMDEGGGDPYGKAQAKHYGNMQTLLKAEPCDKEEKSRWDNAPESTLGIFYH